MPFTVTFAGCEKRHEIHTLIPTSYILYLIRLESRADGKQYFVQKRFKELKAFHRDVAQSCGVDCRGQSFPNSAVNATEFLTGATVDPKGSFVQGRKIALESFFQQLIKDNPKMFDHEKVLTFFEMNVPQQNRTSISQTSYPQYSLREKYGKTLEEEEDVTLRYYLDNNERHDETERQRSSQDDKEQQRRTNASPELWEV